MTNNLTSLIFFASLILSASLANSTVYRESIPATSKAALRETALFLESISTRYEKEGDVLLGETCTGGYSVWVIYLNVFTDKKYVSPVEIPYECTAQFYLSKLRKSEEEKFLKLLDVNKVSYHSWTPYRTLIDMVIGQGDYEARGITTPSDLVYKTISYGSVIIP